jgi:YihY family inner membrane protein
MPTNAKTLILLATKTWEQFGKDNCSQMAAAITYHLLFAVVPLTIFLVSVASVVLPDDARADATERVEDFLNVRPDDVTITLQSDATDNIGGRYGADALPEIEQALDDLNSSDGRMGERAALAEMVDTGGSISVAGYELTPDEVEVRSASFIGEIMEQAADAAVPLGIFGFFALAFSASIAFSAIRRSLNFVWKVPHRPFAQQRLLELMMLMGLVLLLGASVAATAAVQILQELSDASPNPIAAADGVFWFVLGYVLPWAFTFVLVLIAYRFVPNAPGAIGDMWLGALLASGGIEVLKYGYGVYVANFASYGAAYGALGGVLLFMFFGWLSSYIFLMGAEFAATYPKVMGGEYAREEGRPSQSKSILETLVAGVRGLFVSPKDRRG